MRESLVHGDCSRLMQVLVNLLSNAIKFTRTEPRRKIIMRYGASYDRPDDSFFGADFHWSKTGRTRPDLTQEAEYGDGRTVYLYYAVIDSGKGIAGESIDRVFSKFEQADRRTHTKYGGSGLGLFISRELVEMQGGQIGIKSEVAAGSTFAFYIKARCVKDQAAIRFDSTKGSETSIGNGDMVSEQAYTIGGDTVRTLMPEGVAKPVRLSTDYRILLVEDNLLNQKVLAKQLRKAGCTVYTADHGGEAIDFIRSSVDDMMVDGSSGFKHRLDCILMDWEMPVCDGLRATRKIRELEQRHNAGKNVIIGVTANARAEQIARAVDAGMDTVMPKPFRVAELLSRIGQLVAEPRAGDMKGH